ncbi:MAG TPA: hypothetical protein VK578_04415 [Edaphobacter sp.]|nr:hypothetical protein [Edaphobacter sp.]
MILEVAILNVIPGFEDEFEAASNKPPPSSPQCKATVLTRFAGASSIATGTSCSWSGKHSKTIPSASANPLPISNGSNYSIIFMLPSPRSSTMKIPFEREI